MTCRELADFLMDYVSGELPPDVLAEFERHLNACHNCREYLVEYRAATEAGKLACTHADDPVPADVPEDLVQAILEARKRGP
jgi:anti-sigma factor RsiW